MIGYWI